MDAIIGKYRVRLEENGLVLGHASGINFVASGMPYWSTDIGGWQGLPWFHKPERTPLIDPSDARDNVHQYDDFPELYVRWFEYGAFQPTFRAHGSRNQN